MIRPGNGASGEWPFAAVLAAAVACLVVFMGLAVANFVSVAQVHGSASVKATASVGYLGLASDGTLPNNGTARAWVNVTVVNPGPRALVFDTVIYKLWIEDLPHEAGFAVPRKDVPVANGTAVRWLFDAYSGSNTSSAVFVPAFGSGTVPLRLDLTEQIDLRAFVAVQNITDFAVSKGVSATAVPWELFILTSLWIDGVPQPTSPTAPIYQIAVGRLVLQQGTDFEH